MKEDDGRPEPRVMTLTRMVRTLDDSFDSEHRVVRRGVPTGHHHRSRPLLRILSLIESSFVDQLEPRRLRSWARAHLFWRLRQALRQKRWVAERRSSSSPHRSTHTRPAARGRPRLRGRGPRLSARIVEKPRRYLRGGEGADRTSSFEMPPYSSLDPGQTRAAGGGRRCPRPTMPVTTAPT